MSADNGIYIGRFKKTNGKYEYRVICAQAIENCDYSTKYSEHKFPKKLIDGYRVNYYGKSPKFSCSRDAWMYAWKEYDKLMKGEYGICEYGVSQINYDVPFPKISSKEANEFADKYWEKVQDEKQKF